MRILNEASISCDLAKNLSINWWWNLYIRGVIGTRQPFQRLFSNIYCRLVHLFGFTFISIFVVHKMCMFAECCRRMVYLRWRKNDIRGEIHLKTHFRKKTTFQSMFIHFADENNYFENTSFSFCLFLYLKSFPELSFHLFIFLNISKEFFFLHAENSQRNVNVNKSEQVNDTCCCW